MTKYAVDPHELTIRIKFDSFRDHGLIHNSNIIIEIDGKPIGCVQELKLHANSNEHLPQIEVSFPDFKNLDWDKSTPPSRLISEIDDHINQLKQASNIKINRISIDSGEPVVVMGEVGTDGFIESIPMERRNK